MCFIAGNNDSEDNTYIAGVVDTSEQLIAHVADTADTHNVANISENFHKNLKCPQ